MSGGPCIGVCMMDDESGLCLGCGRSAEEIAGTPAPAPDSDEAPAESEGGQ